MNIPTQLQSQSPRAPTPASAKPICRAPWAQRPAAIHLMLALALACGSVSSAQATHKPGKAAHSKTRKAAAKKVTKQVVKQDTAGEFANFGQWKEVAAFVDQMVAKHDFNKQDLEAIIRQIRYVETTIQLIKPAPSGRPKNWHNYRNLLVDSARINGGVRFWNEHADELARAEAQYGIPAEIIIGILGVETVYGKNTGNFRVMDAITTLAFAYPDTPKRQARMEFFRGELENVLLFAREAVIDPFSLLGSYAGAIGWPQFMPSSIRQYAVDFDGDGKIDLRTSPADAIGSVANFLQQHGWKRGEPIVFPATVWPGPDGTAAKSDWDALLGQGLEARFKPEQLRAAGVTTGMELPDNVTFGLVDLQNGQEATEYWLGTTNFFAITQYNRSYFYAMSVVELGRAVHAARTP